MESIGKLVAVVMYSIRSGSQPEPLFVLRFPALWGIAAVGIGVSLFFRGFPYLKRKRLIENTPTSTVRGVSLGAVEINGTVVGPYTLISPISESDCFYYRASARSKSKDDNTSVEESLYAPFFLDDGTGRLLVDPRGAEIELQPSVDADYSPESGDAFIRRFLIRRGISSEYPATLKEYCIRPGDHLFVMGTLRENPGLESAAECLVAGVGQEAQGFLSAAAADLQRQAAIASMLPSGAVAPRIPKTRPVQNFDFDLNPPVVVMKGTSTQPFFISWRRERDVVGQLAVRSVLYILGGPIIALIGLWLLINSFSGQSTPKDAPNSGQAKPEQGTPRCSSPPVLPLDWACARAYYRRTKGEYMASLPLLPLPESKLIGIARLAAEGESLRQGHEVEYFTLPVRSLLNRCTGVRMPFEWTINPYRGCEFACKYCYARYTHEFMEMRDGMDFEQKIFVKQHAADLLRQELRRVKPGEQIAIGTATDPYQPAERRFEITRGILQELTRHEGLDLGIITKGNLILRDLDLLKEIGQKNRLTANVTITTLNVKLARILEPRAPRPDLRMDTVRQLNQSGIRTGVSCSPVIPGITDSMRNLEALVRAIVEAGGKHIFANPLFLKPCSAAVFLPFLEKEFPQLAADYQKRYKDRAFLPQTYGKRISQLMTRLREKHGMCPSERRQHSVPAQAQSQLNLF